MKKTATRLPLLGLLLSFLAPTLASQTTYIVDPSSPGLNQVSIAVFLAQPGDTILVRPSAIPYDPFTVRKGVRIVGGPGVSVRSDELLGYPVISIEDLPAGEELILSGFTEVAAGYPYGGLSLTNNAGTVHLEDLDMTPRAVFLYGNAQVSFQRCVLSGLQVRSSEVLLSECSATAQDSHALYADDSRVTVAGGTYSAGFGAAGMYFGNNSTLFLTGDFDTTIEADQVLANSMPAIDTSFSGSLVLDPDPRLRPGPLGGPAIGGAGQVTTARIPYLHTSLSGSVFTATVETWPGASVRLYYSPFVAPFAYSPTTPDVWVGRPRLLSSAIVPASGASVQTFVLPSLPPGLSFPMQAVVQRNGQLYLSNPVVSTLAK